MTRLATADLRPSRSRLRAAFPVAFQLTTEHRCAERRCARHGRVARFDAGHQAVQGDDALNSSLDPSPAGFVAFYVACLSLCAALLLALSRRWLSALAPGGLVAASACPRCVRGSGADRSVTYSLPLDIACLAVFPPIALCVGAGRPERSRWCLSSVGCSLRRWRRALLRGRFRSPSHWSRSRVHAPYKPPGARAASRALALPLVVVAASPSFAVCSRPVSPFADRSSISPPSCTRCVSHNASSAVFASLRAGPDSAAAMHPASRTPLRARADRDRLRPASRGPGSVFFFFFFFSTCADERSFAHRFGIFSTCTCSFFFFFFRREHRLCMPRDLAWFFFFFFPLLHLSLIFFFIVPTTFPLTFHHTFCSARSCALQAQRLCQRRAFLRITHPAAPRLAGIDALA